MHSSASRWRTAPTAVSWLALAALPGVLAAQPPDLAGCDVFPAGNIWNVRVDDLPLDPMSATYVASIGTATGVHPDFGSGLYEGAPIGIPWTDVPGNQTPVPITFGPEAGDESDPGPYPIPPDAPIEGGAASSGDRHVLVVDRDACVLYELFYAFPIGGGTSWEAYSGAVFDLTSHDLRPLTWTSADAAGLPILPGLVRYEEVAAGEIRHAIRFTASTTRNAFIWPARHQAGVADPNAPPMGQRFRLKASVEISTYSPDVQVILTALKRYGLILADNGSDWYVSGVPDDGWDNDTLVAELAMIHGSDFEAVDVSSLQVDPDSGLTNAAIFTDGFETGDVESWSAAVP